MSLSAVERFLLAHILYEYGGKLYFTSGSDKPEETLAGFLAEDFIPSSDFKYGRVKDAFRDALKSLKEKWMIELRGYEVILTHSGRAEAEKIPLEEYRGLKKKFSKV